MLLTVTDVSTTGAVVIFRDEWRDTTHSDSEDKLPDWLSKRQSLATTTLLFRTSPGWLNSTKTNVGIIYQLFQKEINLTDKVNV